MRYGLAAMVGGPGLVRPGFGVLLLATPGFAKFTGFGCLTLALGFGHEWRSVGLRRRFHGLHSGILTMGPKVDGDFKLRFALGLLNLVITVFPPLEWS